MKLLPTLLPVPRAWLVAVACAALAGCASSVRDPAAAAPTARNPAPVVSGGPAARSAEPEGASASASSPAKPAPAVAENPSDAIGTVTDPMAADRPVDLNAPEHKDLWDRLRKGFGMPDLNNDIVRSREQWYAGQPDYIERMSTRGGRYLFHILDELEQRHMPTELALLPFVESAFNPTATSSAKAQGMWQFMPATGRHFNLKQNMFRDERRDVLESTRAALDYLERLYGMFGDWHLALAAYNWGEGSVQRAINRNRSQGLPTDYDSLNMPLETRHYVPKLQALKNIVSRPGEFNVTLVNLPNHPYFVSVPIQRDIDVSLAARLAELPLDEFHQLNPSQKKPVILASGQPRLLLPFDNAERFQSNLSRYRGQLATWTAWVVPRTMKTRDAAAHVGMSEEQIRQVNNIPPKMLVRAGSTLLIERSVNHNQDVAERIADNASMALAPDLPPVRRVTVRVGRNDSVAALARRYRVGPAQVAQWNRIGQNARLRRGQALVMWLPVGTPVLAEREAPVRAQTVAATSSRQPAPTSAKAGQKPGKLAQAAPAARKQAPAVAQKGSKLRDSGSKVATRARNNLKKPAPATARSGRKVVAGTRVSRG